MLSGRVWGCLCSQGRRFRSYVGRRRPLHQHSDMAVAGFPNGMTDAVCFKGNLNPGSGGHALGVRKEGKTAEKERELVVERVIALSAHSEVLQSF